MHDDENGDFLQSYRSALKGVESSLEQAQALADAESDPQKRQRYQQQVADLRRSREELLREMRAAEAQHEPLSEAQQSALKKLWNDIKAFLHGSS